MSNGQYESLRPFITDRVQGLVRERLLEGIKFFDGHTLRPEYTRAEVKLTILLVRIANPKELLSRDEADLIESGMRQMQNDAQKKHSSAFKQQKNARKQKRAKPGV